MNAGLMSMLRLRYVLDPSRKPRLKVGPDAPGAGDQYLDLVEKCEHRAALLRPLPAEHGGRGEETTMADLRTGFHMFVTVWKPWDHHVEQEMEACDFWWGMLTSATDLRAKRFAWHALHVLAVQHSSVSAERVFSVVEQVTRDKRSSSMSTKSLEMALVMRDNKDLVDEAAKQFLAAGASASAPAAAAGAGGGT